MNRVAVLLAGIGAHQEAAGRNGDQSQGHGHPQRPGPGAGVGWQFPPAGWGEPLEERIIEEQHAEREGEKIEEAVIAGEEDQGLEEYQSQAGPLPQATGREDQERDNQLDAEHYDYGSRLRPGGQLMRVPTNPRRQRLCFVMELQGGQAAPGWIATEQLHAPGLKHQLEQQPAQQPQHQTRGRRGVKGPGPQLQGCQKDRQEAGFQQQDIPLESEKLPADRG